MPVAYWVKAWDDLTNEADSDPGFIGHGGEWETSLQLYLRPALVDASQMVADPERLGFSNEIQRFTGFPERRREREHGVHGDSTTASAEKGERLFTAARAMLVRVCREYHELPVRGRDFGSHCL